MSSSLTPPSPKLFGVSWTSSRLVVCDKRLAFRFGHCSGGGLFDHQAKKSSPFQQMDVIFSGVDNIRFCIFG